MSPLDWAGYAMHGLHHSSRNSLVICLFVCLFVCLLPSPTFLLVRTFTRFLSHTHNPQLDDVLEQRRSWQQAEATPAHPFGGAPVARLHAALRQPAVAAQFDTLPIGPLGCYVKIKSSHQR